MNTLKISGISLMLLLAIVSCKKNEKADPMPEHHAEEVVAEPTPDHPKTTATFVKESHDFGILQKGEVVKYVYEITNTGDKPLYIYSVEPACGCTAPDYTKEPIAAGQKGQVTLQFESKNFTGPVHKTAQVVMNTDQSPVTLSFKANVQ